MKLTLDVRRQFACPACGRITRRHGDVTSQRCHCQDPPVWMRLVEEQRESRPYQPYLVPELAADELLADHEPQGEESPVSVEVSAAVEEVESESVSSPIDEIPPPEQDAGEIEWPAESATVESPEIEPAAEAQNSASETGQAQEATPDSSEKPPQGKGKRSKRRRSSRKRNRRSKGG